MGGNTFFTKARGKTAREAFNAAVEQAKYDHGHAGYTGTIAEKYEAVVIALPAGRQAREYADELIAKEDPRVDDKWGPAGAIQLGPEEWLFFGWASS